MTVGELRAALEGVPGDMPAKVYYDSGFGKVDLEDAEANMERFEFCLVGGPVIYDQSATCGRPCFVISSRDVWLPGNYDSERTARWAFRFPNATLAELEARVNGDERRPITAGDLRATKAAG